MKKEIVVSLFFWCMTYALTLNAVELKVAYEYREQYPNYLGKTEAIPTDKPGVAVEMVKLLENYVPDLEVSFVRYPWARCISSLRTGNVDGIFKASFMESRLEIGAYPWSNGTVDQSRRISTNTYAFYTLKSSNFKWNGKEANPLNSTVGAPIGYSVIDDLKKMGLKVETTRWTSYDFKKLLKGRVMAVAAQQVTGNYLLKKNSDAFSEIKEISPPISIKHEYLMLSHQFLKQHPDLAEIIWNSVREIREKHFDDIFFQYQ